MQNNNNVNPLSMVEIAWTENRVVDYQKREVTIKVTVPFGTNIASVIEDLKRQVKPELDKCVQEMKLSINSSSSSYKKTKNNYNENYNVNNNYNMNDLLYFSVPEGYFGKGVKHHPPVGFQTYGYTLGACSSNELAFLANMRKSAGTDLAKAAKALLDSGYSFGKSTN